MGSEALPKDYRPTGLEAFYYFDIEVNSKSQHSAHVHDSDESLKLSSALWLSKQQQHLDCLKAAALVLLSCCRRPSKGVLSI